jgi:hypothetical protein
MATTVAKLQVRRGNQTDLPVLDEGEFGYASDTQRLFIGNTFETFTGTGAASQVLTLTAKTAKPDTLTVLADAGAGYSKLALTTDYTLASNAITLVAGITGTIKVGYNSEVALAGGEQKMHHVTLATGTNVATGFSFDSTSYNTLFLDYSLKQGVWPSLMRVGTLRFITDGVNVSLTDSFDDLTTTLYFTFNAVIAGGIVDLQYSQSIASTEFFFQIRTWNTSV